MDHSGPQITTNGSILFEIARVQHLHCIFNYVFLYLFNIGAYGIGQSSGVSAKRGGFNVEERGG